jgi:hypothetical protein
MRGVVRVELEVPRTPEQVWEAIATGPGITAAGSLSDGVDGPTPAKPASAATENRGPS